MLIITTYIKCFICEWDGDGPWKFHADPKIECLSEPHIIYMVLGFIGLIIYYPVSTFMFPNF